MCANRRPCVVAVLVGFGDVIFDVSNGEISTVPITHVLQLIIMILSLRVTSPNSHFGFDSTSA